MLQSSLSGQVASVGMLVCAAKQNRCRKILAEVGEKKWGEAKEGGEWEGGLCWGIKQ